MTDDPVDDAGLVARLCAGEEAAFAQLLDAWSPGMLRLARSIVTTEASAAEVVQETWLAVVGAVDQFEGRSSLRTWVYRILVNTAKRRAGQERRSVPWASLQLRDEPTVEPEQFQGAGEPYPGHWRSFPAPWPEQAVLSKEVLGVIRDAVDRLPPQQRAVITLRDIEGCSAAETCELLDLSEGNQRVLLHRARTAVRRDVDYYVRKGDSR